MSTGEIIENALGDMFGQMFQDIEDAFLITDDEMFAGLDSRLVGYLRAKLRQNPQLRAPLCRAARYRREHRPTPRAEASERRVYFVAASRSGFIKIGSAAHPAQRVATLQTGSPEPLELIGDIAGGECVERDLHRRFAADRSHGEWFTPSDDLLEFIAEATR